MISSVVYAGFVLVVGKPIKYFVVPFLFNQKRIIGRRNEVYFGT